MKKGHIVIVLGAFLSILAIILAASAVYTDYRAGDSSEYILTVLDKEIVPLETVPIDFMPDYMMNPNMAMPVMNIDNTLYIGVIEFPTLDLRLPVANELSYPNLKRSPCRYKGSVYLDNCIIAAHNYSTHFGPIKDLHQGDRVRFIDVNGNVFGYEVSKIEIVDGNDREYMENTVYNLTLFTCTIGGAGRVTVRCTRVY